MKFENVDARLVLLAGGSGSRLWPMSRQFLPKQFLPMQGQSSLLELVSANFGGVLGRGAGIVVSSSEQVFGSAYNLLAGYTVLAEPLSRNTAAAAGLAAVYFLSRGEDPVLLISPCDYLIKDKTAFRKSVDTALSLAKAGELALLGVKPLRPDPSYGYISLKRKAGPGVFSASVFLEKPAASACTRLLRGGGALWHTGIVAVRASLLLALLEKHSPAVASPLKKYMAGQKGAFAVPAKVYSRIPSLSLEKAVFEKQSGFAVVELRAGWTDIENWASLYQFGSKDKEGNVARGDALAHECRGSLVYSGKRLVAALGLRDCVVADTGDALLVCPLERTAEVSGLASELARKGRLQVLTHETVRRPWGSYTELGRGPNYLIKRLELLSGAAISLQYHRRRSEHWTVISGTAGVICGKRHLKLKPGASVDIPLGVTHSLSNPGRTPLEVVEVQNGEYIGEDDIVRLSDPYLRPA